MFAKFVIALALLVAVAAYAPRAQVKMAMPNFSKALSIAAVGIALAGPAMPIMPAMADGAVSKSTVYRARTNQGTKILDLEEAVNKGNFDAFANKKTVNTFDLFISGSNALNGKIDKERAAAEKKILATIYSAVESKDANKLRSAYADFIKVANLKPDFKPEERGQTDSSGYAPTWGTKRQYIYQR